MRKVYLVIMIIVSVMILSVTSGCETKEDKQKLQIKNSIEIYNSIEDYFFDRSYNDTQATTKSITVTDPNTDEFWSDILSGDGVDEDADPGYSEALAIYYTLSSVTRDYLLDSGVSSLNEYSSVTYRYSGESNDRNINEDSVYSLPWLTEIRYYGLSETDGYSVILSEGIGYLDEIRVTVFSKVCYNSDDKFLLEIYLESELFMMYGIYDNSTNLMHSITQMDYYYRVLSGNKELSLIKYPDYYDPRIDEIASKLGALSETITSTRTSMMKANSIEELSKSSKTLEVDINFDDFNKFLGI